jgi:hypothetical protein
MKTNVSSANDWAAVNGTSIAVSPTHALVPCGKMIPRDVELRSDHPTGGHISRVQRKIDWLLEAFNPAKYPWFRNEFIQPWELKAVYMGAPLTHLSRGFDRRTVTPE